MQNPSNQQSTEQFMATSSFDEVLNKEQICTNQYFCINDRLNHPPNPTRKPPTVWKISYEYECLGGSRRQKFRDKTIKTVSYRSSGATAEKQLNKCQEQTY